MLMDIWKLPLPPADSEPTPAGWRMYLETVKPIIDAEHWNGLTSDQKKMIKLGMLGVVEGLECPDVERVVPYTAYREKLQVAKTIAWAKEQATYRGRPSTSEG